MSKARNNYTAEKKVEILREHFENRVPIEYMSFGLSKDL